MEQLVQQLVNGLMIGSTYAVVALGFGLVFSVMVVVNLAHPDIFMVGAYAAFVVIAALGIQAQGLGVLAVLGLFIVVLLAAMAVTGVVGLALERLVIRPTRGTYILIPFIATAGVSIFLQNGAQRLFGPDPVPVPSIIPLHTLNLGGVRVTSMQLTTLLTAVVIMIALRYYVRHTKWGRATRAVAERPEVAAACGVNINLVSQLTVSIASAMAGAAGVTLGLLYTSAAPFMGLIFGLKSFVCMLVAGNRHIEAIMAVGLMLGVVEALVTGYVSSNFRDAVAFGLLLAVLFFRPQGLFGSYEVS
jgi:branched-chain amino acid transport system permease protein